VLEEGVEEVTATKITRFLGTAPKNSPELLPDTAAQIARNCKLYSGDLIPYPAPVLSASTGRSGVTRTIHALRNPDTGALQWLSWLTDVNIVTPATDELNEQRFYYTGDGAPKVSTYDKAISGAGPYPAAGGYYDLGLPLPTVTPVGTETAFTAVPTATVTRDNAGNVTLTTGSAHNLTNGAYATVSGFTSLTGTYSRTGTTITVTITAHGLSTGGTVFLRFTSGTATSNQYTITVTGTDTFTCADSVSGATSGDVELDLSSFNITTEVTVVNSTTISYLSPGFALASRAYTAGKVDLGGQIQARSYLYTWFTPWLEESVGSSPSDAVFIKEGQIVTVSSLPTAPPSGSNFVRAIRLYRTVSGTTDTAFYRLKTLWFPNRITTMSRSSNVTTATTLYPHALIAGDRVKVDITTGDLAGADSFDITDGIVTTTPTAYTFTYAQTAANAGNTSVFGYLYYDVSETPADTARYWGYASNYDFTDDFNYRSLLDVLSTTDYTPPPSDLKGLTVIRNSILAGFSGNDVYFSEPGQFHAWPLSYKRSFESTIVGLAPFGGSLLVLTDSYPYVVEGNDPATMTTTRLSSRYPCLNARSIVETSTGVIYSTHDGLAIYSSGIGAQLLTRVLHSSDTWTEALNPSTIVATQYKDAYFASHSSAALVFDFAATGPGGQATPSFVDIDFAFTAAWYDTTTNYLYLAAGTNGSIYRWDNPSQPAMTMRWKSKVFKTTTYDNLGAARIIADYSGEPPSSVWAEDETTWGAAEELWDAADPVTFKLYVNKSLLFTTTESEDHVFRLPAGYKSDTFEVEVSSTVRVRAIHLANSASDLRNV
jgi:hypothetical protein